MDVQRAQTSPGVDIGGEISQAAGKNVHKPTHELRLTICRVIGGGGDSVDATQTVILYDDFLERTEASSFSDKVGG